MSIFHVMFSKVLICLCLYIFSLPIYADSRIELVDDGASFYPAQEVTVRFITQQPTKDIAHWWLGVFNKGEPNLRRYLAYKYLNRAVNNTVKIKLPSKVGEYELLLATDQYDVEKSASRITLRVVAIDAKNISLYMDSTNVKPEERFIVQFNASVPLSTSAWVGIFSAGLPHGQNHSYASYRYVKQSSQLAFTAPSKAGEYELRFMDADPGNQVLALPFSVGAKVGVAKPISVTTENKKIISKTSASSKKEKADKLLNNIKALAAKGTSKREQRQAMWAAKATNFLPMQDKNIKRLIATQAQVAHYMEGVKKKPNAEQEKIMRDSVFAGEFYNAFLLVFKEQPELQKLDNIAKKNNYSSYQKFANNADRIQKILMAVPWVLASRNMVFGNQPKPKPIDNLLAYLQDESKPKADREKMTKQLYKLIGEYKTNKSDVAFVTKHYAELKPIFDTE